MTIQIKRSYLEIKSLDELVEEKKPFNDLKLEKVSPPDFQLNKFFYKNIGKKHKWIDRLNWRNENWIDYINSIGVNTFVLKQRNELVGYFEQIYYKDKQDCEIAYFGILEEYIGKKYGGYLLTEAIKNSFLLGSKRVWVHTCSLDHHHALKNYLSRGMKIFQTETLNI